MRAALALAATVVFGIGGTYLGEPPPAPTYTYVVSPSNVRVIQANEQDLSPLSRARKASFLIGLPGYHTGGSATLVSRKKLENGKYRYRALTAYHVVDDLSKALIKDPTTAKKELYLVFQPSFHGQPLRVTLSIDDIDWALPANDWASFTFEMGHKLPCVEVATEVEFKRIRPFEKIYAIGSGGGYIQMCREGTIGTTHNQHRDLKGQAIKGGKYPWNSSPDRFFRPSMSIWYGDSGGGIFNKDGKLIGIVNAFTIMHGWDHTPVEHSGVALKAHIIRQAVEHAKDFFLVED